MNHLYAIGLGSNRRHGRHGAPAAVLAAALDALTAAGVTMIARSATHPTPPLGPSGRQFANAAAIVESPLAPPALLQRLKAIEAQFGRRAGRRWGARVLDLDILLWSGGGWRARTLAIPHAELTRRRFALLPLLDIAPDWTISSDGRVRHHAARLTRPRPIHRSGRRSGP